MTKFMYRIPEAVDATGIGRSKLYAEMASGRLASVKVGKTRLIPAEALTEYVELLKREALVQHRSAV